MGTIPREDLPIRAKQIFGMVKHRENGIETEEYSQMYNKERYKFMLSAPFEVSNMCCKVMKKSPVHLYGKQTGRKPFTAQMASESRLRTSIWIKNGCNAFNAKNPISNPMSFWTEQDVLLYIKLYNIPICSVYGDVVIDYESEGSIEGQMDLSELSAEYGLFDTGNRPLKTSGLNRTGCMFCGYGCHLEKNPNRFEQMKKTHPKQYDYIMKDTSEGGLGYKKIIDWINEHGNMNIKY